MDPALPAPRRAAADAPTFGPLPALVGMARRSLDTEPGIAGDMLADVERAVTQLTRGAALLRSICDDYDGGMLPATEAMVAVRDVVRRLPWAGA